MSKHSGINATRDVLKDQLALAAEAIITLSNPWPIRAACVIGFAIGWLVGVVL